MFRWRMFRHGAHHVNSPSSSGASARPTSTSPSAMMHSSKARSSGSCPMAVGLRSFGCTSRPVRATFRSPPIPTVRPALLADMQADSRVPLRAVPVAPVALEIAEPHGQLIERRLDLLQANHVRTLAIDPLQQLPVPRADAVDVPGGDPHSSALVRTDDAVCERVINLIMLRPWRASKRGPVPKQLILDQSPDPSDRGPLIGRV